MAAEAKAIQSENPQVSSIILKEGGIEMGFLGVKTHLPGPLKAEQVQMELDRKLGSILVSFDARQPDGKSLPKVVAVPLSHVKQFELA